MLATLAFSLLVIDKEREESTLLQENNFFKQRKKDLFCGWLEHLYTFDHLIIQLVKNYVIHPPRMLKLKTK